MSIASARIVFGTATRMSSASSNGTEGDCAVAEKAQKFNVFTSAMYSSHACGRGEGTLSRGSTVLMLDLLNVVIVLAAINAIHVFHLGNMPLIGGLVAVSVLLSVFLGVYHSRAARRQVATPS